MSYLRFLFVNHLFLQHTKINSFVKKELNYIDMRNILLAVITLMLCLTLFLIFKNDNIKNCDFQETSKESVVDTSKIVVYWIPVKKEYSDAFFNSAVHMLKTSEKDSTCSFYKLIGGSKEKEESDTIKHFLCQFFINEEAFNAQLNSDYFKAFKDTIADMVYLPLDSCRDRHSSK